MNSGSQFDGIYIDRSEDIAIYNNTITLENDYVGLLEPHIDCIQITDNSENAIVENNVIKFEGTYYGQAGIYILQTTGEVVVRNNNISSKPGKNIHIYLEQGMTNCKVYNNTIVGKDNFYILLNLTKVQVM